MQHLSEGRVSIIGMGNELNGDDGVGVVIARRLLPQCSERLHIAIGGTAPENLTGAVRAFAPDVVILVDAVDLGAVPGTLHWFDPCEAVTPLPGTHSPSLAVFALFIRRTMGCDVWVLGVQVTQTMFGSPMTPAVETAVERAVALLVTLSSR